MKKQIITFLLYLLLGLICIGMIRMIRTITNSDITITVESEEMESSESEETLSEEEETSQSQQETVEETEEETEDEIQEALSETSAWKYKGGKKQAEEKETETESIPGPPNVIIATDLHLLAKELVEDGKVFREKVESDDGKTTLYSGEIIEACLEEVILQKPDALVLSGDLTFEGEKLSHQELVERLKKVQEAGIQVLAIPGNHDINNPKAASYLNADETSQAVETITPEEFAELYYEYGYAQAMSRDENSLSYTYALRDNIWMMMLDTNIYEPENLVEGEIRPETYQWMIQELDKAKEAGIQVIPIGHHNLLSVSRFYTSDCMIRSRSSAIWLFQEYKVPLYLSGHLHVARVKKNKAEPGVPADSYGIHEIVTSSLTMTPHQYAVLSWEESGQLNYQRRWVNVEEWARKQNSEDENLIEFNRYSRDWYYQIVGKKIYSKLDSYPEEMKEEMAYLYADILYHYGAGEFLDQKAVESSKGYKLWERLLPDDKLMKDMKMMLRDMKE